jgi:hypothetical protein
MRRRGVRGGIGVRIGNRAATTGPAGAGAIGIAGITAGDKRFERQEMTTKRKAPAVSPGGQNEIVEIVSEIMMRGWLNSLTKAKQEAAKGDLDAAKDVKALNLWIDMVIRRQNKAAHVAPLAKQNKVVRLDDFRCDLSYVERKAVRKIVAILDAAGGKFIEEDA